MNSSTQRKLVDQPARKRVAILLGRYPDISADETAEILRLLKKGRALEVGVLAFDRALRPKLERFRADHAKEFAGEPGGLAAAALIIAGIVAVCVLLWDAGAGPLAEDASPTVGGRAPDRHKTAR